MIPCSTEEFPRKAKKPEYPILVNTKIEPMRHWKEARSEYLESRLFQIVEFLIVEK